MFSYLLQRKILFEDIVKIMSQRMMMIPYIMSQSLNIDVNILDISLKFSACYRRHVCYPYHDMSNDISDF